MRDMEIKLTFERQFTYRRRVSAHRGVLMFLFGIGSVLRHLNEFKAYGFRAEVQQDARRHARSPR